MSKPHIIFPYFPYQENLVSNFTLFEELTRENESFITVGLNCDVHKTVCSKFRFVTGKIYISMPPHKIQRQSNREITVSSLKQLADDAKDLGVHVISSMEEITEVASQRPLFLLIARTYAGDLESKVRVLTELGPKWIHRNVQIALLENDDVYKMIGTDPLSTFAFVPPSFSYENENPKLVSYRGEFDVDKISEFITQYEQPVWGEPIPPRKTSIAYVGPILEESIKEKFVALESSYPLVYINSTSNSLLSSILCENAEKCFAIINFQEFRKLDVPCTTSVFEIAHIINEFHTIWNAKPLIERVKSFIFLSFALYSKIYFLSILLLFVTLLIVFLFYMDYAHIIPDDREKYQKKKAQ